jgi:hypothetical protein
MEQSLQIGHSRFSPGLVCEFGTKQESYRVGKEARPTINLQRYITPVPAPAFAEAVAVAVGTNVILQTAVVPEGKVRLVTHLALSISLTVAGTVNLVIRRENRGLQNVGYIAVKRRDVSSLYDLDINLTTRIWLDEGEGLELRAVLAGAGVAGLASAGMDAYDWCAGTWPGV